jgi:hypothetical protein
LTWRDHPAIRPTGALNSEKRAEHYANPPSNPGFCGFQLDKQPGRRNAGYERKGVTYTSSSMARKGMPFR